MSKNIFVVISSLKDICYLTPATKVAVAMAECDLRVSFSDEYKQYVKTYGAVRGKDFGITGVCTSKKYNVVNATNVARQKSASFPKDMYVVEDTGVDELYILQNQKGEIFSWVPGVTPQIIFNSLAEYLKDFYG